MPTTPSTIEDEVSYYTEKAGDINRKLGLSGIAIIWFYRFITEKEILLPGELKWPLGLIMISLVIDALQYSGGTILWFHRWTPATGTTAASKSSRLIRALFSVVVAKLLLMIVAYGWLLYILYGVIVFS